jgi:TRAP-type C4-dicarboxylate transport system substrate-binding protein
MKIMRAVAAFVALVAAAPLAAHAQEWPNRQIQVIRANLVQSAQEPIGGTAESFARFVSEEFEKYARLVKELSIKVN